METLVKEDWPAAFSSSFVSSCSFGFLCLFSGSLGLSPQVLCSVLPVSILFVSLSLSTGLLHCCCWDAALMEQILHCYFWCEGDERTMVDKGNLLGLNIYTSSDAGSLLQEDWIVSTNLTGIYRNQRAWCEERCVHYCNILFRPIRRSRGAWEQRGLDHSLGVLLPWFFVFDHKLLQLPEASTNN